MNGTETVLASAEAAVNTVGTDRFLKLSTYAVRLTGTEISRRIEDGEDPGLFAPADIVIDGKDRVGAILTLADRLIVAWTVGTLRIKNFEAVVPYDSIQRVERMSRPGSAMSKEREVLEIVADSTWTVVFANVFESGRSIVPFLQGMIEGAIKPVFSDAEEREEKRTGP